MGWNSGYSKLEKQIVELYDINELTIEQSQRAIPDFKNMLIF